MTLRRGWLLLWFFGLGCHSFVGFEFDPDSEAAALLWQQGQEALGHGQPKRAIGFYEKSLAADPSFSRSHMSLAAAYLESGDDRAACGHLGRYLDANPEHAIIRAHYAELLLRLHRCREARREFERFTADAQDGGEALVRHLVHAHTRLMELAEDEDDEYATRLHRGLGLYWLAFERTAVKDADGRLAPQGLLFRAAAELARARCRRPEEARPCWYLYAVWSRLGQKQLALGWLRVAADLAPFSDLAPAERRSLELARRSGERRPCWRSGT
jgi:tetratricopeptide (TPR) repeat protein